MNYRRLRAENHLVLEKLEEWIATGDAATADLARRALNGDDAAMAECERLLREDVLRNGGIKTPF